MNKFIALFKSPSIPDINQNSISNTSSPSTSNTTSPVNTISKAEPTVKTLSAFTDEEKDEIISTLSICTLKSKSIEEREEEFMTMCITHGVDDEDMDDAKEIFLYRDPEDWELNILALEKGEWASSMATENFKRWRKVRPAISKNGSSRESLFVQKSDDKKNTTPDTSSQQATPNSKQDVSTDKSKQGTPLTDKPKQASITTTDKVKQDVGIDKSQQPKTSNGSDVDSDRRLDTKSSRKVLPNNAKSKSVQAYKNNN